MAARPAIPGSSEPYPNYSYFQQLMYSHGMQPCPLPGATAQSQPSLMPQLSVPRPAPNPPRPGNLLASAPLPPPGKSQAELENERMVQQMQRDAQETMEREPLDDDIAPPPPPAPPSAVTNARSEVQPAP